jgi:hypothetical protein
MRYAELLLTEFDRLGYPVRDTLQKGLTERRLAAELKRYLKQPHPVNRPLFPQTLPESLVDLYGWHNGGGDLVPYFRFLPFQEALEIWDITSEAAEDSVMYENGNAVFADTSPFPFLLANADFMVMDVGEHSPTRGSIGCFTNNGCSSVRNEFATLSQFFRAHYECCKAGVYSVGEHGLEFTGPREPLARFRTKNPQTTNGATIGW